MQVAHNALYRNRKYGCFHTCFFLSFFSTTSSNFACTPLGSDHIGGWNATAFSEHCCQCIFAHSGALPCLKKEVFRKSQSDVICNLSHPDRKLGGE